MNITKHVIWVSNQKTKSFNWSIRDTSHTLFFSIRTIHYPFFSSRNHEMALFFFSSRSNNIIFFFLNEGKWHHRWWWRQTSFGIPFQKHPRLIAWFYQLRNPSRRWPLSWIKSVIKNDCTIECRRCGKLYEIFHSAGSHILFRPERMCTVLFPGTADQLSIRLLIFSYKRKMIFWVTSICKRFNKEWQLHYRGCTISFSFILIITSIEASETDNVIDLFYNLIPEIGKYYCCSFYLRHIYIRINEGQENLVTLISLY